MSSQSEYQVVYNVGLLDDIHNYFPALLYQSSHFTSLTQVFHYVRHQMNTRFNLLNYGAGLARMRERERDPPTPIPTVILTPQMRAAPAPVPAPAPAPAPATTTDATANLLLSLLTVGLSEQPTNIWNNFRPEFWASFRQPVVVAPSTQTIETSSEILSGSTLTDPTICAICQDSIQPTDTLRRLTACTHTYHQVCIDQWFLGSPRCPTCRHDIRDEPSELNV